MIRFRSAVAAALLLGGAPVFASDVQATGRAAIGAWGVDTSGFSKTVRPGDDFYSYVNERWQETTAIPPGMSSIEPGVVLSLSNEKRVAAIIRDMAAAKGAPGTPEQQIADAYAAHSDRARRNALGLRPIATQLRILAGLSTKSEQARAIAQPWLGNTWFGAGVIADADDPRRPIAAIVPAGLTMPSRDYYLNEGEPFASLRSALRDYIAGSFRRAGIDDADGRAARVLALEIEIARRHWTTAQKRDVVRDNHVMSPADLKAYAPGFDWDAWLTEQGFAGETRIKVANDTAVRDMASLWAAASPEDLRSYLLFHALDNWADELSEDWREASFDFHSRKLRGIGERRTPEQESIAAVSGLLGEEIGRIYVARHFPARDRAEVDRMVGFIRAAFRDRITKLSWMDEPTRAEALTKLDKVVSHIGYPDRWHDRSMVRISPDDHVGNMSRILAWGRADSLAQLREPTRRWEFPYVPQEVNAGYMASLNSVTFPAGILQPPFFDPAADPAVNFGAIAAVIGHEFGHGFDDQGSRSDGDGRLRDWWTAASRAEFERRTAGLVAQFDAYEPVPGTRINGRQNLGENIGDLGGLSIAHEAYRRYVAAVQGGQAPVIDGWTGDQRFFLSWGQIWQSKVLPDEQRRRLLSDNHSPGQYRVNGIVRNIDAWYAAFGVKPGDKLYLPEDQRVRIW